MITLRIGRLELDWGKNSFFQNHSVLFKEEDLGEAEYFYAEGHIEAKAAYVRKLRHIIPRLELLGYSLVECEKRYVRALSEIPSYYPKVEITFDVFLRALCGADVDNVKFDENDSDFELGEFAKHLLSDPEFNRIATANLSSVTRDDATFFENLDAYVVLRLLAENSKNLDKDVVWGFQDVLENGYVEDGLIFKPLRSEKRFLIVTEGSSDSSILKASLPIVANDVSDFFDFVDMKENYPFTGTGSLVNFCKGLAAIRVQNEIVVVLDNDAAGNDAFERLTRLKLPDNMRLIKLPCLKEFERFLTFGPSGESYENVNGRAVSIECFLDLSFGPAAPPAIRWTGYNQNLSLYQGELISKERYISQFFENVNREQYNSAKLALLWGHLLMVCASK